MWAARAVRESGIQDGGSVSVGFNATRRYRGSKRHDVVLLIVGIVVITVLVAWASGLLSHL
jgi:hypothetical protein